MKCIGVLGGLGPQATMDFEARIHRVAQRFLPPKATSGYPPLIVHYIRHAPILFDANGLPLHPIQIDPDLFGVIKETARQLGMFADFLVMPANMPHVIQKDIEEVSGKSVLSMIDVTLAEVSQQGHRHVGLLGLGIPQIYLSPLQEKGVCCSILPEEPREHLNQAIIRLQEGRASAEDKACAAQALTSLREEGCTSIILGCTELVLLLQEKANAPDLVNPAHLLAEAAVRYALA